MRLAIVLALLSGCYVECGPPPCPDQGPFSPARGDKPVVHPTTKSATPNPECDQ